MAIAPPKVILRLGSHAEKEYFEKLAKSLDGFFFGANLLEITPGATSSLIFALKTLRGGKPLPYYLDPMTYCFGPYIDPETSRPRRDLEAIKSERLESRKSKKRIKAVKDSYKTLAGFLGPSFAKAVNDGQACRAIDFVALPAREKQSICEGTLRYQLLRIQEILAEDDLLSEEFGKDGTPAAVFAPYFFVHHSWADEGLEAAIELARLSAKQKPVAPVHAIICASPSILDSHGQYLADELPGTGVSGAWLWFDNFDESQASPERLTAFRTLVNQLSLAGLEVHNMHGGYFSLLLAHDGLTGISHGIGYGERKPVAQVIGAAAPTVRYYLPSIKKRASIGQIEPCLPRLGIKTAQDFYSRVCDCQICKGIIKNDIDNLSAFGVMHRANPESKKDTQTPAAAKMCRYHFLINRFKERAVVARLSESDRATHIEELARGWRKCPTLREYVGTVDEDGYLENWSAAFNATI